MTTSDVIATVSAAVSLVGLLFSCITLWVLLYDRRTKLKARGREGDWLVWKDNLLRPEEKTLFGIIEVYNASSRANTISSYSYRAITRTGEAIQLFSEIYKAGAEEESRIHNQSPLVIAPYTGVEVPVMCFVPRKLLIECSEIEVTLVDIHSTHQTAILWKSH